MFMYYTFHYGFIEYFGNDHAFQILLIILLKTVRYRMYGNIFLAWFNIRIVKEVDHLPTCV